MKEFNSTSVCIPSRHYMVDISDKLAEIKKLVDDGKYFTINRARQYGKTTTITALCNDIQKDYFIINIDFQDIEDGSFANGGEFSKAISRILLDAAQFDGLSIPDTIKEMLQSLADKPSKDVKMDDLFRVFRNWFQEEEKPIILIADEVDTATNNQVFLDFLAQLRSLYIKHQKNQKVKTFRSVILAGVTDIKHLKAKIREDADSKENSPWNIAADFNVDMSLSENGIRGMLEDYEKDHKTGMDTANIAKLLREYTNGYPFLVSRICQMMDTRLVPDAFSSLSEVWTADGVEAAVKMILTEKNTLFDSLIGKLRDYDGLRRQLRAILLQGETIEYLPDNREQEQLLMYGFIVNNQNTVAIANRIFEMRLYKYFVGESRFKDELRGDALDNKPAFTKDGELNVPLIMERFIETQKRIRNLQNPEAEKRFIEEEGREKFLTYLSPIINGVGTYSVEEHTRNRQRMDVVIHYLGKRYIIELKIWRGERYNAKGEQQIIEYLDYFGLTTGYMLSFNFNKKKTPGVCLVKVGDKLLYEGTV